MDNVKRGRTIGIILAVFLLFLVVLVLAKWISTSNLGVKELIPAVIGFVGSIIGGALTLIGVKLTLDKQERDMFIESFPRKSKCLHQIIEALIQLEQELDLNNAPYVLTIKNRLSSILDDAVHIDGRVYFQLKMLHILLRDSIDEFYNGSNKLYRLNEAGIWETLKNKEDQITAKDKLLRDGIIECLSFLTKYDTELIKTYEKYTRHPIL